MAKETKEKILEEKRSRYSSCSIIMRQLLGTRWGHLPGYILLQDVIYKHLENRNMSIKELIAWATSKFTFETTEEEAYEEIFNILTINHDVKEDLTNFYEITEKLVKKTLEEATDLYEKQQTYEKVKEEIEKFQLPFYVEQDIIKIVFQVKRGKTLAEAIDKIAEEYALEAETAERASAKKKMEASLFNTVMTAFPSEMEMLEFAENID